MANVISIISGKGGVGKTFFSINLANAFSKQGKKALIIDFDLFHANVHIYLDKDACDFAYLNSILNSDISLKDGLYKHKQGFFIIPSSTLIEDVANLDVNETNFSNLLEYYSSYFDYILVDTPPGINEVSKIAIKSSKYSIVVSTNSYVDLVDNMKMINYAKSFDNNVLGFVANKYNEFSSYDRKKIISFFNLPEIGKIPYLRTNDFNFILSDKKILNHTNKIADNVNKILN